MDVIMAGTGGNHKELRVEGGETRRRKWRLVGWFFSQPSTLSPHLSSVEELAGFFFEVEGGVDDE
ncbi:MAG: hypothetical protein WEC72_00755, partial [Chthoniobacterales bacterium]